MSSMHHHDITQSLPWDDILRRQSDASFHRRDSIVGGERRNSLLLTDVLFDFPLTPGVSRDHNIYNYNDNAGGRDHTSLLMDAGANRDYPALLSSYNDSTDPFAPISYGESTFPLVPSIARSNTSVPYDRLLGDRSESSVVSVPTIVSLGSYSISQQNQHQHQHQQLMNQSQFNSGGDQVATSMAYSGNSSSRLFNQHAMDNYQRNQSIAPIENVTSGNINTKKKTSSMSATLVQPSKTPSSKAQGIERAKRKKEEMDNDGNEDDAEDVDDEDGDDDDSSTNRFKPFHEEKWTLRYKELLDFHQTHGHSAVPHTYPTNPQLARWVKRQRRQYKLRKDKRPSTMTTERLDMLATVGFIWDSHDVNWREKLEQLIVYRREYGNCNVPSNHRDKKLATWVKCQRRQYKLYWDGKPSAMGPERIIELEKVGFEWEIRSTVTRKDDIDDRKTPPPQIHPVLQQQHEQRKRHPV